MAVIYSIIVHDVPAASRARVRNCNFVLTDVILFILSCDPLAHFKMFCWTSAQKFGNLETACVRTPTVPVKDTMIYTRNKV